MITTLHKTLGYLAKRISLASAKSLSIKMMAVFLMVSLNPNKLLAQSNTACKSFLVLKPISHRVSTSVPSPLKPSSYTVLLVKNFPTLNVAKETLLAMEENEPTELEMLCNNNREKNQVVQNLLEVLDITCTK